MIFFDAFLDTYFLHNFNNSATTKREYTTQVTHQEEPGLNLAHAGLNLSKKQFRGRFALQMGDSVGANTMNESNPDLGHIQESYLGFYLGNNTWIDGGIYFAHIGMESWISKNNITYTRSMLSDYVPYYSTGIRISHDPDISTHFEFHILNGWQNISETNSAKSIGFQFKKKLKSVTLTYNNFFGDEKIQPQFKNRFRTYHNFFSDFQINDSVKGQVSFDFGTQSQQKKEGIDFWNAQSCALQFKLNNKNFTTLRIEHYSDPNQANVLTNTENGFRVFSTSLNYDTHVISDVLWRTEIRFYQSQDKIFTISSDKLKSTDSFLVTSLSVTI